MGQSASRHYESLCRQALALPSWSCWGRGGGDAGPPPDLISLLPDDMLREVITLLPTKDGARTQILSRGWRPLWRSAALNLDASVTAAVHRSHVGGIVIDHQAPVRRVALTGTREILDCCTYLENLLRSPSLDTLQELELHFKNCGFSFPADGHRRPPPSVFRFSATLRVLSIDWNCYGAEPLVTDEATWRKLGFPCLNRLTLNSLNITETSLHSILSRCPVLQSMELQHNIGYRRLRISSSALRSLSITDDIDDRDPVEEIIIEDAPMLERLVPPQGQCQVKVNYAPKLKALGYLYCRDYIGIHTWISRETIVFKKMEAVSLNNTMRTVKILAIVAPSKLDIVVNFLQCFPCVEKMYIKVPDKWLPLIKNDLRYTSVECLDAHLRTLQITYYHGYRLEINLVRFFLSNARVLESMKLIIDRHDKHDNKWFVRQYNKLQLQGRASPRARFDIEVDHFPFYDCCVPTNHTHDLAVDDPFDRSSCTTCPWTSDYGLSSVLL